MSKSRRPPQVPVQPTPPAPTIPPTSSSPPPPRAVPLPPSSSSSLPSSRSPASSSPYHSRPSSTSTSTSIRPSLANHSSLDRTTPAYASQRGSLQFEGDSLDGSYAFVLSAPASAGQSPAHTPHGPGVDGLTAVLDKTSLDTRAAMRPPLPPVPAHVRPNASSPLSSDSSNAVIPQPLPALPPPLNPLSSSSSFPSGPRRPDSSSSSRTDDAKTVEFYLKQAIQAHDASAMSDLLEKARKLNVDASLLSTAHSMMAEKRTENVSTLSFYLKQSVDTKNREGLKMALEKLDPLLASMDDHTLRSQYPELLPLVEEGRRQLANLDKESAQTVHFYLKQGIQLRNRDVIKQSLEKTPSVPPELLDKELTSAAQSLLTELDAQHLIKFYLQTAIKQKDDQALEMALEQAKKLRMGGEVAEVTEGHRLLMELRTKSAKKSKWKGGRSNGSKASKVEKFVLFGGPLIEAVRRSDQPIPKICYQCMDFLRAHALQEPGLFRVAGNKDAIEAIRHEYEEGDGEVKLEDVHDVAGVFKLYLRMLPEPLIPYAQYDHFIRVGSNAKERGAQGRNSLRNAELREQVAQLPPENYALLCSLMRFLVEVARQSEVNKMTAENLAIVFAPNLIRPAQETANSMLYDMPLAISIIAAMILFTDEIFTQPPATAVTQMQQQHSAQPGQLSSTLPGPITVSSSGSSSSSGKKVVNSQTL